MASSWRSPGLFAACGDHSVKLSPDGGAGGAGGSGGVGGSGAVGGSGGDGREEPLPDPADPLFSATSIPRFEITLTQEAIDSLSAASDTYVPGDVTVTMAGEATVLPSVGVRLKGVYGSFRDLGQKAAFLLNFHKFTEGQTLFGLKKLALNNMVQDASMIHEHLAYTLFRAMGVPASRSAYATVRVNGSTGGTLAFCFVALSWDDAEADCIAQGGHLISIHDQETQDLVVSYAFSVDNGDW